MCSVEKEIRLRIVQRLAALYPKTSGPEAFDVFLVGSKPSINSWAGDCFPVVLNFMRRRNEYDQWRSKLFCD